ncbi:oxidoreductase [Paraliobacillus quinghaiensis]|uniref:Oxidoreductase n=1 Tax=Paraliobacillus quinghaiensis TaxID=470815 RepID=A0A917TW25_9BACI|nr:FAD-dependent oxidoreductase [Paraliobacillus quinghaiensis]GGM40812.1 oxidoreductase [Paraliobacillus quinghaiensis]
MSDYIVIGAGILGASTAYHLAKYGESVTIIDKKHAGQATEAAAGIVCPWLSQRRNKAWYSLAKAGASYYPTLINKLKDDGETETGYKKVGAISIRQEEKKLDAMFERAQDRRISAPEIGEITKLSPTETKSLFPPLADGFGSVHISGAARVNGQKLRDALLNAAKKHGAEVITGEAELKRDNEKVSVYVNEKVFYPDKIIITASVWANALLKPLDIEFLVEAQKAQIMHLELPENETNNWPVVMPPSDHYLVAYDDQRVIAGATHENNLGFDYRVTPIGMQEIIEKALDIAPGLAQSTVMETRVGFRPSTPGYLPVIGALPGYDHIYVANGLGSSGLTTGPYLGQQLAHLALGEETTVNVADYPISGAIK